MRKFVTMSIAALLTAGVFVAQAQPIRGIPLDAKKEAANNQLEKTDYYNAEVWAGKVLEDAENDPASVYVTASALYNMRDYVKAASWFKRLLNRDTKTKQYQDTRFYLARSLKMSGNLDEAQAEFETFIANTQDKRLAQLAKTELDGIRLARTLPPADPAIKLENIGSDVNSSYSEISPVSVSPTQIYYSALSSDVIIELPTTNANASKSSDQEYFNKIFTANFDGKKWTKGDELPPVVNRADIHNAHVAFANKGNTLYFSRCGLEGSTAKCNLFVSEKANGEWSEAVKLEGDINNDGYSSKQPALGTINGKEALFFVSDMQGGLGGLDIYYAVKESNTRFGTPVNLGAPVNTIGDEQTPFVRGTTLYFSSDGHPNIGGLDVFRAEQKGIEWSGVTHLGAAVNSSVDDWYYSVDATGYKAFFVSNRKGGKSAKSPTCCYDIYSVEMPVPVIVNINALALDKGKNTPLNGVTVELVNLTSSQTDPKTNERGNSFLWEEVQKGITYRLVAKKEGYEDAIQEISTANINASKTIDVTLSLKEIEKVVAIPEPPKVEVSKERPLRLRNIYFDYDKATIRIESHPQLDKLAQLLRDFPAITKIELSAHTDARGSDSYNLALSERRAKAAVDYLVKKGIDPSRISYIGRGESQILNQCTNNVKCSDDEHLLNRRVEIRILQGPSTVPADYFLEGLTGDNIITEQKKNSN